MFDQDFVSLRSPGETLRIRISRTGVSPTDAEQAAARRAIFLLRLVLEASDSKVIDAAQKLMSVLDGNQRSVLRGLGPSAPSSQFLAELLRRITAEFRRGRLIADFEAPLSLALDEEGPELELPPLPPRRPEGRDTFFDVRYVDEVGQAINGLEVEFLVAGSCGASQRTRPASRSSKASWRAAPR